MLFNWEPRSNPKWGGPRHGRRTTVPQRGVPAGGAHQQRPLCLGLATLHTCGDTPGPARTVNENRFSKNENRRSMIFQALLQSRIGCSFLRVILELQVLLKTLAEPSAFSSARYWRLAVRFSTDQSLDVCCHEQALALCHRIKALTLRWLRLVLLESLVCL